MSEKLVVEFLRDTQAPPVAVVMSWHGGDNPASAALTIAAFYTNLPIDLRASRFDARELASRFILWRAELSGWSASSLNIDAVLIEHDVVYGYQLVRVRTGREALHIELTTDEYTTESELREAEAVLKSASVSFEFIHCRQLSHAGDP